MPLFLLLLLILVSTSLTLTLSPNPMPLANSLQTSTVTKSTQLSYQKPTGSLNTESQTYKYLDTSFSDAIAWLAVTKLSSPSLKATSRPWSYVLPSMTINRWKFFGFMSPCPIASSSCDRYTTLLDPFTYLKHL